MFVIGSHTEKTAPVGSAMTAIRPNSMTSNAGATIEPPAASACFAVCSAFSTVT
jgi:hypothetical protein